MVFVIDIVLMFMTSVISNKGKETYDQSVIFNQYTSRFRFYADMLSLLGAGIFQSISSIFTFFGLFKIMRVFRLGPMISKSNVNKQTKAILNLSKLIFYMFFYMHCLSCFYWQFLRFNSAERYYRRYNGNHYISLDGEVLIDQFNQTIPADDRYEILFNQFATFDDYNWARFTEEDTPDWKAKNERFESRLAIWYMPLNWDNYES